MESEKHFYLDVGKIFSKDRERVERAYLLGMERQDRFRTLLREGFPFEEALTLSRYSELPEGRGGDGRVKLGIIGRPYYTHDPFLRRPILEQMEGNGYQLLTTEVLSNQEIEKGVEKLRKRIYWSFGKELVGAAIHFAQGGSIKGIINLASFGCGQDSFNFEMIQHIIQGRVPILSLTFDEHLSMGSFSTKMEAFLEMIAREVRRG